MKIKKKIFQHVITKLEVIDSKLESIQKVKTFNMKVLTSKEAALALRVTTRTLQTYRDQGIIPFFQFGREVRYHAEDIQQFLIDHYVKPSNWKGGLS
jgi:excisionase family DNA binding protein